MRRLLAILLLLPTLASAQPAPALTANWQGAHAVVTWSVPGNLYRHGADGVEVWLGRFEVAGSLTLSGPDDAYTPQPDDIYVLKDLVEDRVLGSAQLGERPPQKLPRNGVALPMIARPTWHAFMPMVGAP